MAPRAIKDNKEILGLKDLQGPLDVQDLLVVQEDQGLKAKEAILDSLARQVVMDSQVELDYPVLLGQLENPDRTEQREIWDHLGKRVSRDQKDHWVHRARQDQGGPQVKKEQ